MDNLLIVATEENDIDRIRDLLDGETCTQSALDDALVAACTLGFFDIARCLVREGGANAKKAPWKNVEGSFAPDSDIMKELILLQNSREELLNAFPAACENGDEERAANIAHALGPVVLIKHNFGFGNSGLHLACKHGLYDLTVSLAQDGGEAALRKQNFAGEVAYDVALRLGNITLGRRLLELQGLDFDVNSLLLEAFKKRNLDTAEILIKDAGANVNYHCGDQMLPLHLACLDNGEHDSALSLIRALIDKGGRINAQDSKGRTPLAILMNHGRSIWLSRAVALLLEHGADPNIQDNGGSTPLFALCSSSHHCGTGLGIHDETGLIILADLLAWGADVNARTHHQRTSLHAACARGDEPVIKFLLDHAATKQQETHGDCKQVQSAFVNASDQDGNTPLHFACECPRDGLQSMALLLQSGADLNAQNRWGDTPLIHTFYHRNVVAKAKQLLKVPGIQISPINHNGHSALTKAIQLGSLDLVQLILDLGVPVANEQGLKALELAHVAPGLDMIFVLIHAMVAQVSDLTK